MRDGLINLPSLGQTAGKECYKTFAVRHISLPIYHTTVSRPCQALKPEFDLACNRVGGDTVCNTVGCLH